MKYLENEYSEDFIHLDFDFQLKDIERLKELKALFHRRYFDTEVKIIEKESEIENEIKNLDLNSLTPLQALMKLEELKKKMD